ncbi:glycosyltransferase [Bacillus sp. FJAT-49732]|uniref:Glycosyltransferase n=1 Tax=Lederbergia citrisecunda TaxID=2833583 RepID=A0A942TLY0_9BACI|nr:glycosyltransferase [Lederbergia citrisecunda]MBS4198412.1 glycosyltransferase [Lederbergia citrisecunda]
MTPKLSIIVPIYKVEKYLPKCIDSILAQTFTDFELILVNDGSPDNCGRICDEYAKRDKRIIVIHKENGGLSSARNAGIKVARGKYIGFVDSDDFIDKNKYHILLLNAELHSSDVVVCDVIKVNVNKIDELNEQENKNYHVKHFTNIQALNELYNSIDNIFDSMGQKAERWIFAVNKIYKRSLFYSLKFEEGRIFEDEYIAHKIYYQCTKITSISAKLYYYVQRPDSIVNTNFSTKKFDRVYALKDRSDFFKHVKELDLHEKAFKCYVEVLFWNYLEGRLRLSEAKKELKQLKKTLNGSLLPLIKNPYISSKQKVMVTLFIIHPVIFDRIVNLVDRRSLKAT